MVDNTGRKVADIYYAEFRELDAQFLVRIMRNGYAWSWLPCAYATHEEAHLAASTEIARLNSLCPTTA